MVARNKPPEQWIKINTDNRELDNPGKIGESGIIKDQNGKMVMAFSVPLGIDTNNQVELET